MQTPIAYKYREGKMKRTLKREFKSTWNCQEESDDVYSVVVTYIFYIPAGIRS